MGREAAEHGGMTVIKSTLSAAEAKEMMRIATDMTWELSIGNSANIWASMAAYTIGVAGTVGVSRETALQDFIDTLLSYLEDYDKVSKMSYEELEELAREASPSARQ